MGHWWPLSIAILKDDSWPSSIFIYDALLGFQATLNIRSWVSPSRPSPLGWKTQHDPDWMDAIGIWIHCHFVIETIQFRGMTLTIFIIYMSEDPLRQQLAKLRNQWQQHHPSLEVVLHHVQLKMTICSAPTSKLMGMMVANYNKPSLLLRIHLHLRSGR